jgi:hypothetical protein
VLVGQADRDVSAAGTPLIALCLCSYLYGCDREQPASPADASVCEAPPTFPSPPCDDGFFLYDGPSWRQYAIAPS